MGKMTKLLAVVAACSTVSAAPASAAMSCWNAQAAGSVKLKDLQSKLMVATLRCNAMGFDNSAAYNRFVTANKLALGTANKEVKARFQAAYGAKTWQREYDRFNTSLANAYGADATSAAICKDVIAAARDAALANNSRVKLLAVADRFGGEPDVPGGICRGRVASL